MPSSLEAEVRGDWSNFQGTDYHLTYALWLLVTGAATSVAFYRGNDLLARIVPPPQREAADAVNYAVHATEPGEADSGKLVDNWVQLKATQTNWNCTKLLDTNLLANFVCNALLSTERGRPWRVRLVTQGLVSRDDLLQFIAAQPGDHPVLEHKFQEALDEVQLRLGYEAESKPHDPTELRELALKVLAQLADTQPQSLETLKSQIREQLAYRFPDRVRVRLIERALFGALEAEAGKGPENARDYDVKWLDDVVGEPLFPERPFDQGPLIACDTAVQAALFNLPTPWDAQHFAPRPRLERELHLFLGAHETLFVLVGASGVGKTWDVAEWAMRPLTGRARLFIPATALDPALLGDLPGLVATGLQRLSGAYLSAEQQLARLRAAAGRQKGDAVVLVLDNVAPIGDPEVYRRALSDLVAQCREIGAKLVVTCQTTTWDLFNLGRDVAQRDLYVSDRERALEGAPRGAGESGPALGGAHGLRDLRRSPSFVLEDLSEAEQEDILRRYLPQNRARIVAQHLRAPAFGPLRRPYFLSLFLAHHSQALAVGDGVPTPVDVGTLIEMHLSSLLSRVADTVVCTAEEAKDAFYAVREELWKSRATGANRASIITALEIPFPGQGAQVFDAFRRECLLAVNRTARFAEPLIEEWTFAQMLHTRMDRGIDTVADLQIETDMGVVSTLLRGLVDPIPVAEALLARDRRWGEAVAAGLAQCSDQDYRVLALISVLARPSRGGVGAPGCVALGQLAARGRRDTERTMCLRRAFIWTMQMYLSSHQVERYRGARALSATLDFAPDRVEVALRLRLSRAVLMPVVDSDAAQARNRWLAGALDPLLNTRSVEATDLARRVLERYRRLEVEIAEGDEDNPYRRSADEVRGLIGVFDPNELSRILTDLRSDVADVRFRAARALRTATFEVPDLVQEAICDAIRSEGEARILNRLLWATYRLSETAPDALLDALAASAAADWEGPSSAPGQALATLAESAAQRPERVFSLLPGRSAFDAVPAWERAILSEGFAFAWWTCADQSPAARQHLASLIEPDATDIPAQFRVFALRGAAIARLAEICAGTAWVAELRGGQMLYPGSGDRYLFVDLGSFIERHADVIAAHPDYPQVEALLLRCISDEQSIPLPPIPGNWPLMNARHICARQCLDMLIPLAATHSDALQTLQELPQNERALYAARRLLENGHTGTTNVSLAQHLSDVFANGGDITALQERERLLAQLARLTPHPRESLKELSRAMRHVAHGVPEGRAGAVSALTEGHPEELLALVDDMLESPSDLPTLYRWEEHERSWQGFLVAKVYARMFDARPILFAEARELCTQMLDAVRSLPSSRHCDEYLRVYETLASWLVGRRHIPPQLDEDMSGAVHESHRAALQLLQRAATELTDAQRQEWGLERLAEMRGRGWWLSEHMRLHRESDSFSTGTGELLYVFPAVRLALIAAGRDVGPRDTSAAFMAERVRVRDTIAQYGHIHDPRWPMDDKELEKALDVLQSEDLPAGRHYEICAAQATVLRRLHLFSGAEATIRRSLAFNRWDADGQASLLYDLACGYAMVGREDACRRALMQAAELRPFRDARRMWLFEDPDLASVRNAVWFRELAGEQ